MLSDSYRKDSRTGGFLRRLRLSATLAVILAIGYVGWVKFEWSRPTAALRQPLPFLGKHTEIALDVADSGTGLASIDVSIDAGGTRYQVLSEDYPAASWRGSGIHEKSFTLPVSARDAKIPEGPATLTINARDGSWLNFLVSRPPTLIQPIQVDYSPPSVEVLTTQHYMRLGGSDMVIYKTSKDAARSGVVVEQY
ncbi:MAG TPA: hypothetical protein VLF14_08640, partial [Candidatus Binatia bacterium]|nr:hypothetical protein [Candidatus Binatia bacterium]